MSVVIVKHCDSCGVELESVPYQIVIMKDARPGIGMSDNMVFTFFPLWIDLCADCIDGFSEYIGDFKKKGAT
jgi:hypothetical protein